jgi:hypothetical protein
MDNIMVVAPQRWEHLDARVCIPDSNGLVVRPRDNFGSIVRECDGCNPMVVAPQRWEHLDARVCIPDSNGLVVRPRDNFGSIVRECDGSNPSSWPRSGGSISTPVFASQTRMVLSSDPETILDPSCENATDVTQSSSWPRSGGSISTPVFASQTRMVLSIRPRDNFGSIVRECDGCNQLSWPRKSCNCDGHDFGTPEITLSNPLR